MDLKDDAKKMASVTIHQPQRLLQGPPGPGHAPSVEQGPEGHRLQTAGGKRERADAPHSRDPSERVPHGARRFRRQAAIHQLVLPNGQRKRLLQAVPRRWELQEEQEKEQARDVHQEREIGAKVQRKVRCELPVPRVLVRRTQGLVPGVRRDELVLHPGQEPQFVDVRAQPEKRRELPQLVHLRVQQRVRRHGAPKVRWGNKSRKTLGRTSKNRTTATRSASRPEPTEGSL